MMKTADLYVNLQPRIVSSAGLERCLDRAEVTGSNPVRFTSHFQYIFQLFLFITAHAAIWIALA